MTLENPQINEIAKNAIIVLNINIVNLIQKYISSTAKQHIYFTLYGIVDLSSSSFSSLGISIIAKGKIFAIESPAFKDEVRVNDVFQAPVQIDLNSMLAELK